MIIAGSRVINTKPVALCLP